MARLPSARDIARSEIAVMAEIFEQEGDASAAWRAFFLARRYGCDLPAAIDAEIDRFAEAMGAIAERAHNGDITATIDNETVGKIWKNYQNRDSGGAAFRARRAFNIAVKVEKLRRTGITSAEAVEMTRKESGVSKTHRAQRHEEAPRDSPYG